ncbi:HlyD family efflux transporter periplasmic adaptor subunit [Litoreibacter albidus]|uniref:Membrane fusion protein, adhesin transport system n=1 Tax=Litoreibacter albidus TaxID=670155 RepID=A0A1H2SIW0_9RHOB|nr:HlyD family efflux transporter periplasmic adaptor subunit [Litoreibacter albidus]SDW31512.1 membrane fusion protein, adhesin transport system [Litoreibacter albidus]
MATIDAAFDDDLRGPSWVIRIIGLTVLAFIVWASFAWVDEIVRSEGEFVSSSRPQIIQNFEGGILSELLVAEGDTVNPGDVLARLSVTNFKTSVDDLQDQIDALEIRRMRLEAELAGQFDFFVDSALEARQPEIVASERALLNARQTDFEGRTDGARAILKETRREAALMEDLLQQKIVSLVEATRARKANTDAEVKYKEIVSKAELERASAYSDTLKELATLRQNMKLSQDQLARTVIRSPMKGIVNNVAISTIGGVVRPGEEIFQIIPMGEELFVEAKVKPKDIASLRAGQDATVKLSAYDYTIYGTLAGKVQVISADTFKDERVADGDPHYKVLLSVDMANLSPRQKSVEIRPGMLAQVELHTGEKTILQYLTKPLYKSREAFREP